MGLSLAGSLPGMAARHWPARLLSAVRPSQRTGVIVKHEPAEKGWSAVVNPDLEAAIMSTDTVEPVISALHTLYSDPDPTAKEQANAWLSEFQKSVSTHHTHS